MKTSLKLERSRSRSDGFNSIGNHDYGNFGAIVGDILTLEAQLLSTTFVSAGETDYIGSPLQRRVAVTGLAKY